MHNGEFNEPRLAQVYEVLCPWSVSDQFFLDVANQSPASSILDLGCGTGQITLRLVQSGHTVTGIDPALASLEVAQQKPGANQATWIHGLAADAPGNTFDTALMTNHVAQFLTGDEEWLDTLMHLRRALKAGGRLVFDSRDPRARGWEQWNPTDTREEVTLPDGDILLTWTEVTTVEGENVTFLSHYVFSNSTEELLSRSTLRFRPEQTIRDPGILARYSSFVIYFILVCKPVLLRLNSGSRIYFTPADRELFYFEIRAAQEKLQT